MIYVVEDARKKEIADVRIPPVRNQKNRKIEKNVLQYVGVVG